MKILLLGSSGNIGCELRVSLRDMGKLFMPSRTESDFTDETILRTLIRDIKPDWIINAAAYTNVEKAESECELATQVNAKAVQILGEEAARLNCWLVHYSTDYVFDGQKPDLYLEEDPVGPLCHYAKTKAAGEQLLRTTGCKHLILRTSWVYSIHRENFPMTILKLSETRDQLTVVNDQTGAPTGAVLIADATAHCLKKIEADPTRSYSGTYHLAASGATNWYDYAKMLLKEIEKRGRKIKTQTISPTSTEAYGAKALRPKNSRLNTTKFQTTFEYTLPDWQAGVLEFADSITR
ncbi:MAG: dTDP-4-dehydrorhamnose reductase [Pirellula sp.]|nr:dTDP-4-dehydrorhamnose reductase [Pirellula sp.]